MKKIVYIAAAAAFGILIGGGCAKESGNLLPENGGFSISVLTPGTKTVFNGNTYEVDWEDDDELGIVIDDGSQSKLYKFTRSAGNTFSCADFVPSDGISYTYYALYPYNEAFTITDGTSNDVVEISSGTQSGLDEAGHIKTPLYGMASAEGTASPSISLNHAAAVMKINVANYSGSELSVSSVGLVSADADAVMSGTFSLNFATGELTASETSNTASQVNIDAKIADASSAYFYVAVAPFATEADLSVVVNNEEFEKNGPSYEFKPGLVYTTSVTCGTPEVAVEVSNSTVGTLTQTLEDENVYANLVTLTAGSADIAVQYNGGKYYLCPENSEFQDGVTVKVSLKQAAESHWSIPAEDTYRIVYNKLDNKVTIYSSTNEFNEPYTITWDVANNPDNGSVTTTITKDLFMRGQPSGWSKGGMAMGPSQSLADPQVLVWKSGNLSWKYSGRTDFSIARGLGANLPEGSTLSPENFNLDHAAVIAPPLNSDGSNQNDLAIVKDVWMPMDVGSDLRGCYWNLSQVNFIIFDLRNMRVKFATLSE